VIDQIHQQVPPADLYRVTGLQHLPFNTRYQFATEPLVGRRALLIPDLLGYWLTGVQVAEQTNASTTDSHHGGCGVVGADGGDRDRPADAGVLADRRGELTDDVAGGHDGGQQPGRQAELGDQVGIPSHR
jgi:hypothetical protein